MAARTTATAALHAAVARGDLEAVVMLHADDVDLEGLDAGGHSAMVLAAQRCDAAMVEQLYRLGADPGRADGTGAHPLFEAATATAPSLGAQALTLEAMASWRSVDIDCENEDFGTALEVRVQGHRRRTCRPVRDELLRRVRGWLATQRGLDVWLAGCHHGVTADFDASPARALRNVPMVRRLVGSYVPTLSTAECTRLRHAVYAIQDSMDEEAWYAETHVFSHVTCYAM
eukprot:CAMPEP_0182522876 /NCGR_PEP_ID=MMETSP1323-20130603/627_1 /TAXON_ID=236787 /ORGANISM="Florenciella parvula, Strain RCC1693" /LENGTH=229 /DNA_ID=CAMNT_0024731109 /DNA_START=70 /DNA_END=760 /DNA_ORIENTATION=-